ncbi:MAG: Gfo/Idh/MocA family oxidoreductase [Verrucomicrobiota bacterium]
MAGSLATVVSAAAASSLRAAEAERKMRVAVIGHTGRGDYGHGIDKVWLRVPQAEIVAVADPDDAGRVRALKRLQVEAEGGFADYRKMLSVVKPDVVAIGPRHIDQHRDMAVAAAQFGALGIYIEKPFCRDLAEADAVVQACEKSGTRLAIAHRNRYHPVLPVIKALLEDGAIGQFLEIRVRGKEDQRGGALDLWVLGSHLLNLADYFAGSAVACSASLLQDGRPVKKEDVVEGAEGIGLLAGNEVHARFETQSGVQVFFDSVKGAGTREAGFGLQLIGNEGVIDIRADKEPLAHIRKGNPFLPKSASQLWMAITSAGIGKKEPITDIRAQVAGHLAPAEDLLAAIREKRAPLCSAKDGQVLVEMIMAVFESHRLAGQRVALPLKNREQNPLANLS